MRTRHIFAAMGALGALVAVSACLQAVSDRLPTPISTMSAAEMTAIAAGRPTLPPTFTPSPTPTAAFSERVSEQTAAPPTLTLSPTAPASPTRTRIPIPSQTPTWTPDLRQLPPTSTLRFVGTIPSPLPGLDDSPTPAPTGLATPQPGCTTSPAAANLLQNPGFEGTFSKPQYDDIEVPELWVAFWKPEGTPVTYDAENTDGVRRPGMRVIPGTAPFDNPPRVRTGAQALFVFGGGKVFDAGVFQQVQATNGDTYCLTGFAHAWSQHQSSDTAHSRLVTEDDRRNVSFQLGIDPTGGLDPFASTVTWGAPAHLYDTYQAIPGVEARAQNAVITVFVRGITLWRFEHNDLFFDDLKLAESGS